MADNTILNTGTGGDTIATDDIGGIKYQRVKIVHGQDGQNQGDVCHGNALPVDIIGAMTEFGAVAVAQRANQTEATFAASGTLSTLLTLVNTGTGASDWGTTTPGMATFSTGVTNPSTAKGTTANTVLYRPAEEVYVYFTASFTTGVASTFQRVGLTDEVEGFWVGYEGTSFCCSYSTNSVITSVAQASWNVDTATSQVGSDFTSGGVAVTFNPTKLNLYRIRFGWLGIGPAEFEIMSPDGVWTLLHQFRFPNTQAIPSIRTPNLPLKVWLSSVGSNLIVKSSCMAAGTAQQMTTKGSQPLYALPVQQMHNSGRSARTIFLDTFAVAATTETLNTMSTSTDNGTVTTGTSFNVTAGKRFRIQAMNVGLHTITGNTTAAAVIVRIRANNAGTALVSSPIQLVVPIPGVAGVNAASNVQVAIPDGWEFVGGAGIGVTTTCASFVTTTAAPKVDISIIGFEY